MKSVDLSKSFPPAVFVAEGRWGAASVALLMQATLVLWPVASRWARETRERNALVKMLNELSETHAAPQNKYRDSGKRFHPLAT